MPIQRVKLIAVAYTFVSKASIVSLKLHALPINVMITILHKTVFYIERQLQIE